MKVIKSLVVVLQNKANFRHAFQVLSWRARTLLSEAEAYKQQRIAEAVGGASRFLSLQKEYEKGPDITRTRLDLEALEKVLPRVRLYVVDSDKGRVPLHLRLSGP